MSSVSVCREQVLAGFSGLGNSVHNIISLLKKGKCRYKILITLLVLK